MTTTYHWTFPQFDVKPAANELSNIVTTVHWRFSAIDEDDTTVVRYGTVSLLDPVESSFIEYQDITKDLVISWMESIIDVDDLKQKLDDDMRRLKTPDILAMDPPFPSV
jgi:hypothetical protein